MQQQLLEMTNIPDELQSKITMVTKALEQFMTMDTESLSSYGSYDYVDESRDRSSEKQFSSIPEEDEDIESQQSIDDENSIHSNNNDDDDDDDYELKPTTNKTSVSLDDIKSTEDNTAFECSEESVCETIKSEEELQMEQEKLKKQQKIQTLEQSWQRLCGNTKTIYK